MTEKKKTTRGKSTGIFKKGVRQKTKSGVDIYTKSMKLGNTKYNIHYTLEEFLRKDAR